MATQRNKAYFFLDAGVQTADGKYRRFGADHKPSTTTFEDLLESVPTFLDEAASRALNASSGLVRIATDVQAKANSVGSPSNYSLVPITAQLPTVTEAGTESSITGFSGVIFDITINATTTRNEFVVDFSTAFKTFLDAIADDLDIAQADINNAETRLDALELIDHVQNTDTGTDEATFIINSGGFSSTLDTAGITADRVHILPNRDGTIAVREDLSMFLPLQFEDPTTAGNDVKKFKVPAGQTWTITTIDANNMSTPFGSYRINGGAWTNFSSATPNVALAATNNVEIRPLNAAGTKTYDDASAPFAGQLMLTITRTF